MKKGGSVARRNSSFTHLIQSLFPPPIDPSFHLSRIMIGAFTLTEINVAMREMGLMNDKEKGRILFQQYQLQIIENIGQLYAKWKELT